MACWMLFCLFALTSTSYAQEKVLAILSHDNPLYIKFYDTLQNKLSRTKKLEKITVASLGDKDLSEFDVIISIGSDSSQILSRTDNINNLIYTLIPGSLSESFSNRPCLAKKCQSVLIEQPVERYFQLFRLIFPVNRTLVISTTSKSPIYLSQLKKTAEKYKIQLKFIQVTKNKFIARTLIKGLNKNDVLLALPDPYIYNKNTAKSIILSAYHKDVPIIAYSEAFAKAGALVSLYSSFDDIASQTVKLVDHKVGNKTYFHPETFSIELNRSVASSLDIEINDINELMRAIK